MLITPIKAVIYVIPLCGKLLALLTSIRLGWKGLLLVPIKAVIYAIPLWGKLLAMLTSTRLDRLAVENTKTYIADYDRKNVL